MATTLTYGLVRPSTGDRGSSWFPAIENDITQLDAHSHNGIDSPQLANSGIASNALITRSKLATGTAYRILANSSAGICSENAALTAAHVIYADANGQLAGEATLAISRGGTNAATAILGFNALCPFTTKGDQLGTNGSTAARIAVGTDGQVWTADSASTNGIKWASATAAPTKSYELSNLGLTASVAASALTIALKQSDASTDPAAGASAVKIGFRSSTAASGLYNQRTVTAALSVVVSSGSTLGHKSGQQHYIYVYAIDNAGTVELAVSTALFDEGSRQSTTAEGGAGAADSNSVLYSTSARTNVGIRLIGRLSSTQATAGTWATAIAEISLVPFQLLQPHLKVTAGGAQSISNSANADVTGAVDEDNFNSWVTDTYTTPVRGRYQLSGIIFLGANNNHSANGALNVRGIHSVLGTINIGAWYAWSTATITPFISFSYAFRSAPGDTIKLNLNNGGGVAETVGSSTVFEITYLGP